MVRSVEVARTRVAGGTEVGHSKPELLDSERPNLAVVLGSSRIPVNVAAGPALVSCTPAYSGASEARTPSDPGGGQCGKTGSPWLMARPLTYTRSVPLCGLEVVLALPS